MKLATNLRFQKGETLIEVVIALALAMIIVPALFTSFISLREGQTNTAERIHAQLLLLETEEMVRSIWQRNWSEITNGTYHPTYASTSYTLVTGNDEVKGFTRSIQIEDAYRTASGSLSDSGNLDPSTKKITINIAWQQPSSGQLQKTLYLTKHLNSKVITLTTQSELAAGELNNIQVTNSNGGEITLSAAEASWSSASLIGNYDGQANQDGSAVTVVGSTVYLTRNGGAGNFIILDASSDSPSQQGLLTLSGPLSDIVVVGNFAYISSGANAAEVYIVNVADPANPSQAGTLNLSGNTDATAITATGTTLFVGRATSAGAEILAYDISNPTAPAARGTFEVGGSVTDLTAHGTQLFATTTVDARELLAVDTSNISALTQTGTFNTQDTTDATSVSLNGTTACLTTLSSSAAEVYFLNVSNPASIFEIGSYEVNSNVNDCLLDTSNVFLATSSTGSELIILNANSLSTPAMSSSVNLGGTGTYLAAGMNKIFIANENNSAEVQVVSASIPANGFVLSGIYTSPTLVASDSSSFHHIAFTSSESAQTDIRYQVAVNNDNTTWDFVGPDGTNTSYYEASGQVPISHSVGKYLRFKTYMTGNGTASPVLFETKVNYTN